uniref:Zinc finger protein n=1 Tax=Sipha flava TaxID=143950 RepID=A0A2S2R835_9HEMI
MEDQSILENTSSEFMTLYADQALASHPEQIPNECTNMILDPDNCQNINTMVPLNDLLGQTFIIENNEQPFFVNGTQLITFQHIDANEQIDDIRAISTIDPEKSMIQNINFSMDSNNQFQDIYTNFNKTNNVSDNLKEHLEIINNTDIDPTIENYSNSTAIQIFDDIALSPTDTNNNYILHIASHLTNNLKCPECKKEFKRIASFKSHLKIHLTEESITCNICYKIFDNQNRLDIHKENCMQENVLNSDNLTEVKSVNNFKNCKICKMSISTITEYKMHIKEHRRFDSVLKKQYKFTIKLKKMHKTSNLVKKFKCDHCEWSFNKSNLLNRHMRTHTGEKPFKCSYCSTYFTQQNSLNRHMLKHKGLRPFKCEFCEMNFSQKGHLINHMKRCHAVAKESTRIHECSMCSCVYNSLNALNKHLNTYHGLKTMKLNKNTQKHLPKTIETEQINESIDLIKDSSKLEKWLEEVAYELQNSNNNDQSKHCNDPISSQYEFGLNLIENEQYNHIEKDFSQMANVKTSNHTEIESIACSPQNGNLFSTIYRYTHTLHFVVIFSHTILYRKMAKLN